MLEQYGGILWTIFAVVGAALVDNKEYVMSRASDAYHAIHKKTRGQSISVCAGFIFSILLLFAVGALALFMFALFGEMIAFVSAVILGSLASWAIGAIADRAI